MNVWDYWEEGFKVFGLHGADDEGLCKCGNPECKAPFKHPVISNWQNVPDWSEEQMQTFEQMGHFDTGFGVICTGWLIIDVDARNGGVESFRKLIADIPEAGEAAFVVNTGSGNGSQHHYFRLIESVALLQQHIKYPGIDFKASGYVVGCGSMHSSGLPYEVERGAPGKIKPAPDSLLSLLRKPDHYRVQFEGADMDITDEYLEKIVHSISNDGRDYEKFIRVGMGIHHASGGTREDLWHAWSEKADCYDPAGMDKKWHSFGKGSSLATFGTLMHYAHESGYCDDVTFVYDGPDLDDADPLNTFDIDLKRPPGFAGELTDWINGQCLYPRENLAVAAALCAISGLAGMRFYDETDDIAPNIIAFCVAGSGTGKEAVQQAYLKIMKAAMIQAAVHGGFKSEQELMRNLVRHQAAFYAVDEFGLTLRKLENAGKRGGAAYLEGIVALIMSVFSKANGYLPITGDLKEQIKADMVKELSKATNALENLPQDSESKGKAEQLEKTIERIKSELAKIDDGLDSPFLTVLGYTTPITFNDLMGFEQATNGFMARAMIFDDLETNPQRKKGFKKTPMSTTLAAKIQNLYAPGTYDMQQSARDRVEFTGERTGIKTTPEGVDLLDQVYDHFYQLAEQHKNSTGMEAIPRRGYELTAKASMVLALPEGIRTADHVRWAFALASRDVDRKIKLAYSSDKGENVDGLAARVLSLVSDEHGETLGVICNRLRSTPKAQVKTLLDQMVERGLLRIEESVHPKTKKQVLRYFAA
jgi:polyhydroxyalkanoate synthesis regulator phasin